MATANKNPTSDEAVSGTWDGSAGSRYTVVDDHPDSAGADFLTHGTTTAGNLTFGFAAFAVPAGSTSISVQVIYYDKKAAAQANKIAGRLKVGGSYYNASEHGPTKDVWTLRTDDWANNPKTAAAWTVDDVNGVGVNALQAFGWVSSDANPSIQLSSIIVQVTYTAPAVTLAGVVNGVSTAAGAVSVRRGLAGVSAAVSILAGALAVAQSLGGTVVGVSTVAGALAVARPLAGVSAGVSIVAGALAVAHPLAGIVTCLSTASGALTVTGGGATKGDVAAFLFM